MKTRIGIALMVLCAVMLVSCATGGGFNARQFPTWLEEEGTWRTGIPQAWRRGIQNAPTDAQIETIMGMARLTPTSGGLNDFFFLVLRDPDQQRDVVGPNNAHDGTVTVMIFTDRVLENHARDVAFSPDRGYVSAGTAAGYINLAAITQGFATRMYLTPSGYYGNRPYVPAYVTADKPPIEDVYLRGKGYQYFVDGNPGAYHEPYGSLRFVLAIVIGSLDTTADAQVTNRAYPPNWAFAR